MKELKNIAGSRVRALLKESVAYYRRQGDPIGQMRIEVLLRYGRSFQGVRWETWRGRGYRRRKPSRCYWNAYDYSVKYDGLTYVEGCARPASGGGIYHAWCVTEDDRVVDPTWHNNANEETEYYGIAFPRVLSAKLLLAERGNHVDAILLADEAERKCILAELRVETIFGKEDSDA